MQFYPSRGATEGDIVDAVAKLPLPVQIVVKGDGKSKLFTAKTREDIPVVVGRACDHMPHGGWLEVAQAGNKTKH